MCEWAAFMAGHGIRRVVSLLTASEVATYERPPAETLASHFTAVACVDPKAPGAAAGARSGTRREQAAARDSVRARLRWGAQGTGQVLAKGGESGWQLPGRVLPRCASVRAQAARRATAGAAGRPSVRRSP